MTDLCFLLTDEVLRMHEEQIGLYGGATGLREPGLLDSALAMPMATFGGSFLHRDVFEMAAAYLFHIVMNHPFIDGNKRTGTMAAIVFLELNGHELREECGEELEELVVGVAERKWDKAQIAEFFRRNSSPV